jgi:hypothetical protein
MGRVSGLERGALSARYDNGEMRGRTHAAGALVAAGPRLVAGDPQRTDCAGWIVCYGLVSPLASARGGPGKNALVRRTYSS